MQYLTSFFVAMIVIVIMVSHKIVILIFNMKSSSGWMTTATITLVFTLGYQVHIWQFQVQMPCMCDTKGRHQLYLKQQQLFDLTRGQLYVCLLHKRSKYWHKFPQENFIYLSSWALTTGLASSCHALSEWCGKQKKLQNILVSLYSEYPSRWCSPSNWSTQYFHWEWPSSLNTGKSPFPSQAISMEGQSEQLPEIKQRCGNLEPFAHLAPPYGLVVEVSSLFLLVVYFIFYQTWVQSLPGLVTNCFVD